MINSLWHDMLVLLHHSLTDSIIKLVTKETNIKWAKFLSHCSIFLWPKVVKFRPQLLFIDSGNNMMGKLMDIKIFKFRFDHLLTAICQAFWYENQNPPNREAKTFSKVSQGPLVNLCFHNTQNNIKKQFRLSGAYTNMHFIWKIYFWVYTVIALTLRYLTKISENMLGV